MIIHFIFSELKGYLSKTCNAKILSNIIIGKVAKSSQKNICSNKDAYCIVYLCCSKVMVQ